jgi:hypothetical protein
MKLALSGADTDASMSASSLVTESEEEIEE